MSEPKVVAMKAIASNTYGGVPFQAGDIIQVEEAHVDLFETAGYAVRVTDDDEESQEEPAAVPKAAAAKAKPAPKR